MRTTIKPHGYAPPILELSEHVFDLVTLFI